MTGTDFDRFTSGQCDPFLMFEIDSFTAFVPKPFPLE
jgi:hypothetical protein